MGGGVGLVAACDVALGGESAHFTLPEVRLGIVPAIISPYLAEAIGPRQARRYALTAERMDAATACQLGLLHRVVEDTALESEAARVGESLVAGGPQAMTTAKRLFDEVAGEAVTEAQGRRLARRLAELRAGEAFGFVVRAMTIDFLRPARMDDLLTIETTPVEMKAASFELLQRVLRGDEVLATAKVRCACVINGRAARIDRKSTRLNSSH